MIDKTLRKATAERHGPEETRREIIVPELKRLAADEHETEGETT